MSEIERTNDVELEKIAGGEDDNKKEVKLDLPHVLDPGDLDRWPTLEYTCPKCGCKYTHKNPGGPRTGCSATCPRCPNCGE